MRVGNSSIIAVVGSFILDRLSRRYRWANWARRALPLAAAAIALWMGRRRTPSDSIPR